MELIEITCMINKHTGTCSVYESQKYSKNYEIIETSKSYKLINYHTKGTSYVKKESINVTNYLGDTLNRMLVNPTEEDIISHSLDLIDMAQFKMTQERDKLNEVLQCLEKEKTKILARIEL